MAPARYSFHRMSDAGPPMLRRWLGRFVDNAPRQGTPRVVTDPAAENGRAIRACDKAGFEKARLVGTPDGRAILTVKSV